MSHTIRKQITKMGQTLSKKANDTFHRTTEPVVAISKLEEAFRAAQAFIDTAGVAVHEASPDKLAAAKRALAKAQKLFDPLFAAHEKARQVHQKKMNG